MQGKGGGGGGTAASGGEDRWMGGQVQYGGGGEPWNHRERPVVEGTCSQKGKKGREKS